MAARVEVALLVVTVARVLTVPLEAAFQGTNLLYLHLNHVRKYSRKGLRDIFEFHFKGLKKDKTEYHDSPPGAATFLLSNMSGLSTCFSIFALTLI